MYNKQCGKEIETDASNYASNKLEIKREKPTETDGNPEPTPKPKHRTTSKILFIIFSAVIILISPFFIHASLFGSKLFPFILFLVLLLIYHIIFKEEKWL